MIAEDAEVVAGEAPVAPPIDASQPPVPMRRTSGRAEAFELKPDQRRLVMQAQEVLGLAQDEIALSAGQIEGILACSRLLTQPEQNTPALTPLLVNEEERLFHSGSADLMELPSGGGVRVHFPLEFDLAAFKGLNTPSPAARRLSTGSIVITSRRLSFTDSSRQVEMPFATITGIDLFADMVRIHGIGSAKALTLKVDNPPLVVLAMTQAFNQMS